MKYNQPIGAAENAPFIDAVPAEGIEGSPVPAAAVEHPQREIVNAILEAGLVPDKANLKQLVQAINILITKAIPKAPEKYELCEFYHFRHPTLRPGFQPAQGGLITNAAELYPEAWAYLQTIEGQKLCKPEAEWQALTTATWATLADGSKVGWNGIGGAPFYAMHLDTGALRLPDIRGMYIEAAGFDSLDVGGVHGDSARNFTFQFWGAGPFASGIMYLNGDILSPVYGSGAGQFYGINGNLSRMVPTGNKFAPRAWGALPCVYLGAPR